MDVFKFAERYATVDLFPFPVNLDGVSLNLKVAGKRPNILLNENRPPRRRRFTLAHEIGHVLIPWHVGTIVDEIDMPVDYSDLSYWELEGEANRFAAELLMPKSWVDDLIEAHDDPSHVLEIIAEGAEVSVGAAIIQMLSRMAPGYIYALLDEDGVVTSSGRSEGTLAARPAAGLFLNMDTAFPMSDQRWYRPLRGAMCCWWHFPDRKKLPVSSDSREWRQILEEIIADFGVSSEEAVKLKQSLNGIIGFVNGGIRHRAQGLSKKSAQEALFAACMQRFDVRMNTDPLITNIILHEDFQLYLSYRIKDLVSR